MYVQCGYLCISHCKYTHSEIAVIKMTTAEGNE